MARGKPDRNNKICVVGIKCYFVKFLDSGTLIILFFLLDNNKKFQMLQYVNMTHWSITCIKITTFCNRQTCILWQNAVVCGVF